MFDTTFVMILEWFFKKKNLKIYLKKSFKRTSYMGLKLSKTIKKSVL